MKPPPPPPATMHVPSYPNGAYIPTDYVGNGKMYEKAMSAPVGNDGKAAPSWCASMKLPLLSLTIMVLAVALGYSNALVFLGHGATASGGGVAKGMLPDPKACSCLFYPATSTWVCSDNASCDDVDKNSTLGELD